LPGVNPTLPFGFPPGRGDETILPDMPGGDDGENRAG
jgi:hypothetical protein